MSIKTVLTRSTVVTHRGVIKNSYIIVDRFGVIKEIGRGSPGSIYRDKVDLENRLVMPGFIDTHIHGFKGVSIDGDVEITDLYRITREIVKHGVTSIVPTTISSPHADIVNACRTVSEAIDNWIPEHGSRILGIHLEGPYINRAKKGAHNEKYIREPDINELKEYIDASRGRIIQITIAPELRGSIDLIRYALSKNIIVSIGHTNASYEETVKAIEVGASKATHIFNAMPRLHHRSPGAALALMQSSKVFIEIIADFIHLHPSVVRMIIDYVSPLRTVLVSDAIAVAGLDYGSYKLGDLDVEIINNIPRIKGTDIIAGSTTTLDQAVRNLHSLGYKLDDLATVSSYTPARSINVFNTYRVGSIEKGFQADLVVLDEDLNIYMSIIGGEIIYSH